MCNKCGKSACRRKKQPNFTEEDFQHIIRLVIREIESKGPQSYEHMWRLVTKEPRFSTRSVSNISAGWYGLVSHFN